MARQIRGTSTRRTRATRSQVASLPKGRVVESKRSEAPLREKERQLLQTIGVLLQRQEAANDATLQEAR